MSIKKAWIVFAAALVVVLPLRICQLLFFVEEGTGWYTDGNLTAWIMAGVLLAACILILLMCRKKGNTAPADFQPIASPAAAVFAMLAGAGLVLQSLYTLLSAGSGQVHSVFMVLSAFGLAAGCVIVLSGCQFAVGGSMLHKHPLLALFPSLWGCVCLVTLFVTYTAVVNVSENVYDTFTAVLLLLFLFSQAKYYAGIDCTKSWRSMQRYAFCAALPALAVGLPSVVFRLIRAPGGGALPVELQAVHVLLSLYALASVFAVQHGKKTEAAVEEDSAEAPAAVETLTAEEKFLRGEEVLNSEPQALPLKRKKDAGELYNDVLEDAALKQKQKKPEAEVVTKKELEPEPEMPVSLKAEVPAAENPWEQFFIDVLSEPGLEQPLPEEIQLKPDLGGQPTAPETPLIPREMPQPQVPPAVGADSIGPLLQFLEEPQEDEALTPKLLVDQAVPASGPEEEERLSQLYGILGLLEDEPPAPPKQLSCEEWLAGKYPGGEIFQKRKDSPFYQK